MVGGGWLADDGDDGDDDGGEYDVVLHTLPIYPDGDKRGGNRRRGV
jgi:hypothetical protein